VLPTTNAIRWRRIYEKIVPYMKAANAAYAANVGKRFYNVSDYISSNGTDDMRTWATTWFMPSFTFSELPLGFKVFGEPPDALPMIRDHMEYMFTGVSGVNGTARYCATPGQEQMTTYIDSVTPTGGFGVMLNNCGARALGWLKQRTGDPVWGVRMETLFKASAYAAAWSNLAYQQLKLVSEWGMHVYRLPKDR
jgi:hypothetical protein